MTLRSTPFFEALRGVVLDFDGVVLESTDIKEAAFRELFSAYPAELPAIVEHHRKHLGISRYQKFRWIFEHLLRRALSERQLQELGARFSEIVLSEVRSCPFVPGALELLGALKGRRPVFVASGTPQEELELVVRERGLSEYFEEVWGSPPDKEEILRSLLERKGWRANEIVFVGDGASDYRAARAACVPFIARAHAGDATDWPSLGVVSVSRLSDVLELLESDS